jgi:hypothetical protein
MYGFGCIELKNKFVLNSGSGSGTLRLRLRIPLLLERKLKKQLVRIHVFKKAALKWTRSVCLRAL